MKLKRAVLSLLLNASFASSLFAQTISKEELVFLALEWKGERFADGRPKISDNLLERAKRIMIDDAWTVLKNEGYLAQFEWGMENSERYADGWPGTDRHVYAQPAGCGKKYQNQRCQTGKNGQHQFLADRYPYER
jgi:hypothetical protein